MSRLGTWLAGVRARLSPAIRARDAYTLRREAIIRETSRQAFDQSSWAPDPGHGPGMDERVVEYPWVYARLGSGARLLDVGSTLNAEFHVGLLRQRYAEVVFLNPFRDDGYRASDDGITYVVSDIRSHSLEPGSFDLVTCLSTLEHVACDNSRYGGTASRAATREEARAERARAMREMRRLLRPGGRLLLTVPFGRYEDHGWFVQLDAAELEDAIRAFGMGRVDRQAYRLDGSWRVAEAAECADLRYGAPAAAAVACAELAT